MEGGSVGEPIYIVPRTSRDSGWIRETFVREWHGHTVGLADGTVVHADDVPALVAWRGEERTGLAAYLVLGEACELVAFVARPTGTGVGTLLLEAIADHACEIGCQRIEVGTTNDNLDALRFYQRRGFHLAELHPGKMDEVRVRKPEVPRIGEYGIPLRDVLVLRRDLG
jgi:GNAT superfamily N-acetyltransferase